MMVSRRSLETATALLTGAFGAAVVVSSYGNGIGWSGAGVDPGTFPFIVGLIILSGSIFNLAQGWLQPPEIVLRPSELKRLGMLFIPAAVSVGVIPLIGIYLASAAYTALSLYLIFELTFQISLPRGLLGDALGF
jgi:hypothetical protein